eukprot:06353.XXX_309092_309202_1 [CDS] Oithona nana genome sequencing.
MGQRFRWPRDSQEVVAEVTVRHMKNRCCWCSSFPHY